MLCIDAQAKRLIQETQFELWVPVNHARQLQHWTAATDALDHVILTAAALESVLEGTHTAGHVSHVGKESYAAATSQPLLGLQLFTCCWTVFVLHSNITGRCCAKSMTCLKALCSMDLRCTQAESR